MAATATGGLIGFATSASAGAPPQGPGNIEVFPNRDMVAIDGYTAQAGETATLTVKRGTETVGTATGVVPPNGFIEWNHDSASCFTDVTPDIQPGDTATVSFSEDPLVDGMTVSSAEVTDVTASVPAAGNVNSVTISGTYGPDVNLDRFRVEVVNPTMRDEGAIGERAIGWSPNEAPEGIQGYTVEGTAADGKFSVTFGSMSATDQQLVFDGEKVALSWMADATTVEQQLGLTLAEYGLASGGAPGCPAGPAGARPPASEYSVVWTSETEATVTWASAAPVAGGAAVTGYSVEAIDQAANASGALRQTGYRVGPDATQVVLDGLTAASLYDIEVRSMVAGDLGAPFALAGTTSPPSPDGTGDTTAPVLTTTPAFNGTTAVVADSRTLTLAADEGTIYYTVDGSAVTTQPNGNVPSATAKIYQEPIPITAADTKVAVAVIDAAGNATHSSGVVSPKPAAAAVAPTVIAVTGTAGAGPDPANPQGRVSLAWNPVTDATEYKVRVWVRTDSTGAVTELTDKAVIATGTTANVTGLPKSQPGQRYVFRIQSKTPAATTYSPLSTAVNSVVYGDTIGVISATWRAGDELQIRGSGTNPGATITAHRVNATGGAGTLLGYPTATVGAVEAPGNTGPWEIVVDPAPTTNPGTIVVKSSEGHFVKVTVETK